MVGDVGHPKVGASSIVVQSGGLRTVHAETTLARAKKKARALGITRVTDITRLDRVGLPTFASIRPRAALGSLCVHAGKGIRPVEAEVGAYMEAIEFALAEPGAAAIPVVRSTAREVRGDTHTILDLCPRLKTRIRLDARVDCVLAEPIFGGASVLLPAELVFLPFQPRPGFRGLFGTSSNGLASGNTLGEATLHALCELVERDVRSFQAVRDASFPVALEDLPDAAAELVESLSRAGLFLHVRSATNVFGIPWFVAIIHDPDAESPQLLNGGYGCHPHRAIALQRAVTEAAQSRLSFIHGGRDDLVVHLARFRGWTRARKQAHVRKVVANASRGSPVSYRELPDHPEAATVEACQALLRRRLRAAGLRRAYRVRFCEPHDDLQVVRVVVPGLELFSDAVLRVGPRLRAHLDAA